MSAFVNANVLIRLLTQDDPAKARSSCRLLNRARRGEVELHLGEAIIAEGVFVLSSPRLYAQPRTEIAYALQPVLENRGRRLDHKQSVLAASRRWAASALDFPDCVAIEHALREDGGAIYSYDDDFNGIPGVTRHLPVAATPSLPRP
jgi:predicted nucleic acid-binding protein